MNSILNRFVTLPRSAQIGLMVMTCGSPLALLAILGSSGIIPWTVVVVILIGLALLAMVLVFYRYLLVRRKKRKAQPFEREIQSSGGAVPQAVSDVADRARLDDMRKKFERGVSTFKQHGKDLYGLPWYVIIGEPGSGKSEAIRHCGIGFPPGLQDELQGTGGTINMDWWFTNHAVILDTAGRLTFGDVESTDTREWREFLRLLNKNRPNCPINGLLITIPVDSLIQDDADQLERKGGRIARQLDLIQRTLGVRFPVFIVVTKADKLLGFRQFFTTLRDPQLQHQMLGWSNPQPLDEPFDPALVDEHLQQVRQSLMQRRLSRLLEDTSFDLDTEDSGRRTDHFDELYAFPEAMQRISSRLRRYLEMIFVGGEWSSKPLFLRGIYFTSSMQHGEALDAELADALGVPVESLHEAAWTDDRAYFLRDVFVEKVFREWGLVTNATHTRARQRKRRMLLVGTGSLAAILLAVLIVWGYVDYRDTVREDVKFWMGARTAYATALAYQKYNAEANLGTDDRYVVGNHDWRLLKRDPNSDKGAKGPYLLDKASVAPGGQTLLQWLPLCRSMAGKELTTPLAFKLPALLTEWGTDSLKPERLGAAEELFRVGVVQPLVEAAQYRFHEEDRGEAPDWTWSDMNAVTALAQLIDLHVCSGNRAPRPDGGRTFKIAEMLLFSLPAGDEKAGLGSEELRAAVPNQVSGLQNLCDWLYQKDLGDLSWPPAKLDVTVDVGLITRQLTAFNTYWLGQLTTTVGPGEETAEMTPEKAGEILDALDIPGSATGDVGTGMVAEGRSLADLKSLRLALTCYRVLEDDLLKQADGQLDGLKESWSARPQEERRLWDKRLSTLRKAHGVVCKWLVRLQPGEKLKTAWQAEARSARDEVRKEYDLLLAAARNKVEDSIEEAVQPSDAGPAVGEGGSGAAVEEPAARTDFERMLIAGWRQIKEGSDQADSGSRLVEIEALDRLLLDMTGDAPDDTKRLFEVRFTMYEEANNALAAGEDEGGAGFGKTAAALRGIESSLSNTKAEIDRLARQGGWSGRESAADGWREDSVRRTAACRILTSELVVGVLADTSRKQALVNRFLGRLEAADGREGIRQLVAQDAADPQFARFSLPEVPLTELESAEFPDGETRYNPEVAARLFDDWAQVYSIASQERVKAAKGKIDEYVQQYVDYWSEDESGDLLAGVFEFRPDLTWEGFQDRIGSLDCYRLNTELNRLAAKIEQALAVLRGADGSGVAGLGNNVIRDVPDRIAALTDGMEGAGSKPSQDRYEQLYRKWRSLDSDRVQARGSLLRDDKLAGYFLLSPAGKYGVSDFADRFWASFGRNALALLARETGGAASAAWNEIETEYWRFPLDPEGTSQLASRDVPHVRELVGRCFIDASPEAQNQWKDLDDAELRTALENLQAPLKQDRGTLERLSALVDALPDSGHIPVKVSFLRKMEFPGEDLGVDSWWPELGITQGDAKDARHRITTQPRVDLGTVFHPGDDIRISFYEALADNPDPQARLANGEGGAPTFAGPWSVLDMIRHADVAQPVKAEAGAEDDTGKKWTVEFRLNSAKPGKGYWLLLELEFDKPLRKEALRGWPSLKDE